MSPTESTHLAFGLRFRSPFAWLPAPLLNDFLAEYDIDVTVGAESLVLEKVTQPQFEVAPNQLLFRTRTIADMTATDGQSVHILPKIGMQPLQLANLLLGTIAGALLIQRNTLALHGCSIETPKGAVIFCGDSGAGKSTLAALLSTRGLRILDDNIAALTKHGDTFQVQPGLGYLRLTEETLQLANLSIPDTGFTAPWKMKYWHKLTPNTFCNEPRTLRHVVLLDRACPIFQQSLTSQEKFTLLRQHTFLGHQVAALGKSADHFSQCLSLANQTPCSRLGKPVDMDLDTWLDAIVNFIDTL